MEHGDSPQGPIPPPLQPRGFFTGVKIRAVVVGAVVDYLATAVLGILYLMVFFLKEADDFSEEAIERAWNEMLSSPEGLLGLVLLGTFCTALGGYVAGRSAGAEEVKHGAFVGVVSLLLGLLQASLAGEQPQVPYEYELLGYLLAIPAGALGGFFAQRETIPGVNL